MLEVGNLKEAAQSFCYPWTKKASQQVQSSREAVTGWMIDWKVRDVTFWVQGRALQSQFLFPWAACHI